MIGFSRGDATIDDDNYAHYILSINDERKVSDTFYAIGKTYGRLDILINNAGIGSLNHFMLTPISTVRKILETNIVGTYLCTQEAIKIMRRRRSGRVISMSSVAVPFKLEGEAIYAASKAAVITMNEILAREVASFGITVNTIAPTPVETDLIRNVPNEKIQSLLNRQAIPRFSTFSDVNNVVDFFIDENSSIITGQTIYFGGL